MPIQFNRWHVQTLEGSVQTWAGATYKLKFLIFQLYFILWGLIFIKLAVASFNGISNSITSATAMADV